MRCGVCGTCHNEIDVGMIPNESLMGKLKEFWDSKKEICDRLIGE